MLAHLFNTVSSVHSSKSMVLSIVCICLLSFVLNNVAAQQLAFPGAEGYGKYSVGGRGGKVYEVTTLADDGPGSFRQAFNAYPGQPLTIVFRVGGIIDLLTPIKVQRSNMTLAGQTAPGDGICTKRGMVKIYGKNLIIRYMHFRPGDVSKTNNPAVYGLDIENSNMFIVDHCSMSWSMEEAATFYDNKYSTVQWCIISESLNASYNGKGSHGYAGVWGGQWSSYHHNLLAHHHSRAIRFNGSRTHDTLAYVDYRNNVVYNWGNDLGCYGNEIEIADTGKPIFALRRSEVNIMNNYYKPGPATPAKKSAILHNASDAYVAAWAHRLKGKVYMSGNYVYNSPTVTANNYLGLHLSYYPATYLDSFKLDAPTQNEPIVMQTALDAYNSVLAGAGDTYPNRDTIDRRIVKETMTGTASKHATNASSTYFGLGNVGIIDTQDSAGGWPAYDTTAIAPIDSDHDGIPDAWEIANGLNPSDSTDGNNIATNGYTMLEEYLNSLVAPVNLPVNLTKFRAIVTALKQVQLDWSTANELNTTAFLVERSFDGTAFAPIGTVNAKGAVVKQNDYSFTDMQSLGNNVAVYYRLKIQDKNGALSYSNVVAVRNGALVSGFRIVTNPVRNTLSIAHNKAIAGAALTIYSIDGKKQFTHYCPVNSTEEVVNLSHLIQGTYLAKYGETTQTFIKQ